MTSYATKTVTHGIHLFSANLRHLSSLELEIIVLEIIVLGTIVLETILEITQYATFDQLVYLQDNHCTS